MLDLKYVVNNLDEVKERLALRKGDFNLDEIVGLDHRRRELIVEIETMRREQNEANQTIQKIIKAEGPKSETLQSMRGNLKALSSKIKENEPELNSILEKIKLVLLGVPNLTHPDTPIGKDENDNPVLRKIGEPRTFDFEPKWHDELGKTLGIIDFDRAAKMSGARFAVLKGLGARLERALIQFMLDVQGSKHGYTEILPPFIVNAETLQGTGQLPKFKEDLFEAKGLDREMYLIPTAEVPVTNLHAGEVLDDESLPLRYCAYTPCFRSEAGSYGQDVRGYIRQHQFNKVELVHICRPEESYEELDKLTANAEEILKMLELPYQVISLCSGDIGFSAARTYDIEVWLPGQQRYREISSCSNCEDFQARRMKLRYKEKGGKPKLCHTLNGSGLAVGRTLVAVLENYQQADGSITIPKVLRPYMGGLEKIG